MARNENLGKVDSRDDAAVVIFSKQLFPIDALADSGLDDCFPFGLLQGRVQNDFSPEAVIWPDQ